MKNKNILKKEKRVFSFESAEYLLNFKDLMSVNFWPKINEIAIVWIARTSNLLSIHNLNDPCAI